MFIEIHQLKESGFKKSQIARRLNLNPKTVSKYWTLEPDQFAKSIEQAQSKTRKLDKYEEIIVKWLQEYGDITAAQIEDWLKEDYHDESISCKIKIPKVAD